MAKAQRKIERRQETPQAVEQHHVEEQSITEILGEYKQWIILGLLALAGFYIVSTGLKWYKGGQATQKADTAREIRAFAKTGDPEGLRMVLEKNPDAPEAARQYLALGKLLFDQGKKQDSLEVLEKLTSSYPDFPFVKEVELMKATCLEDLFRLDEARDAYKAWYDANTEHVRAPLALFGQARSMHRMDPPQTEAALEIVNAYLKSDAAKEPFTNQAEDYLKWFEADARAAQK